MTGLSRRVIGWPARAGLFSVLVLVVGGCGSKGSLTGKAKYKETPLPKGTALTFISSSDRAFNTEVHSDDGDYKIEGLPTGDYKVVVKPHTTPQLAGPGPMRGGPGSKRGLQSGPAKDEKDGAHGMPEGYFEGVFKGDGKGEFFIPPKYKDKELTTLSVAVKAGKQELPLQLTD
jgi:hypothetical protein